MQLTETSIMDVAQALYGSANLNKGPVWISHIICPYPEGPNTVPHWTTLLIGFLICIQHIIISFHQLLKGDTHFILEYYPVGWMILEYYAAI